MIIVRARARASQRCFYFEFHYWFATPARALMWMCVCVCCCVHMAGPVSRVVSRARAKFACAPRVRDAVRTPRVSTGTFLADRVLCTYTTHSHTHTYHTRIVYICCVYVYVHNMRGSLSTCLLRGLLALDGCVCVVRVCKSARVCAQVHINCACLRAVARARVRGSHFCADFGRSSGRA